MKMKNTQVAELINAKRRLDAEQQTYDKLADEFKAAGVANYEHKTGDVAVSQLLGRRTLDRKLLAKFLSEEIIDNCYKTGAPYLQLQVRPK